MKLKQLYKGLLLIVVLLSICACQATVGGTNSGKRYELKRSMTMPNEWEVMIHKDVKSVYDASVAGAKDLGLKVRASRVDSLSGIVRGDFADNNDFEIKLSYHANEITLLSIKVGLTGDKTLSVKLFQSIERHL